MKKSKKVEDSGFSIGDINEHKSEHPELTSHRSDEQTLSLTDSDNVSGALDSVMSWAVNNKGKAVLFSLAGLYGLRKLNLLGPAVMTGGAMMTRYITKSVSKAS